MTEHRDSDAPRDVQSSAESMDQDPAARRRILVSIIALLVLSVVSAIGVLAYMNRRATVRSLGEQHVELVNFAVNNVELGLSTGRIDAVQAFLVEMAANPLFAGVILYDPDGESLLQVPTDFQIEEALAQRVLAGGSETVGELAYQAEPIVDADGEVMGHLLLGISLESMNREARHALVLTAVIGLIVLLPMTGAIAWLLTWMEQRLRVRELRLAEVNRAVEIMLNNLDQGIFTMNLDGTVNPQHSLRARELFGVSDFANSTLQQIFGASDDAAKVLRQWISTIAKSRYLSDNWPKYEQLNPLREIETERGGEHRIVTINYRPIMEDGKLRRIMVLGTDITAQREAEHALDRATRAREAEVGRILAFVQNERSAVDSFLEDTEAWLGRIDVIQTGDDLINVEPDFLRELHTLKGNAGSFGFSGLAEIAERMEDAIKAAREADRLTTFDGWLLLTQDLRDEYVKITDFRTRLFSSTKDRMSISRIDYDHLVAEVRSRGDIEGKRIYERLYALDSLPLGLYSQKLQRVIEQYRDKHRVDIADLDVLTPDAPIHRTHRSAFDACLVHLVHNALDHGIESDQERKARGKGPGVISIAYEESSGSATVTVADNGRGIDPAFVADRAIARGLITKDEVRSLSEREKIDLVFLHGFSTKSRTTGTSGRGVGMDAVKAYIEQVGGTLTLVSRVGTGLAVKVTVPSGGRSGDG